MKLKIFTLSTLMAFALAMQASAQERSLLSNVGVSANVGLTGIGATVSTPLGKYFNARAGFGVVPYTYKYTMDDLSFDMSAELRDLEFGSIGYRLTDNQIDQIMGNQGVITHEIDLKAKLNVPAAHVLVDYSPFKEGRGAFHITAGLYIGGSRLVKVHGNGNTNALQQKIDDIKGNVVNMVEGFNIPGVNNAEIISEINSALDVDITNFEVEVGDANVHLNDNGTADAYVEVNAVRPYLGIGWGNAIPKNRVGFRFDIGAMLHGKPEVVSPNYDGDLTKVDGAEDFNKILSKVKFWPQLSFQITFRLLKDK